MPGNNDDDDDTEQPERPPISKRKAPATDETSVGSVSARGKPRKAPRLDLGLSGPSSSSASSSSGGGDAGHEASRTRLPSLPPLASSSTRKMNGVQTFTQDRMRASRGESTSGGTSSSSPDFTQSLSQTVQKAITRDKEKQREREKEKKNTREQQNGVGSSRRVLPTTARKQSVPAKNIRKVSTAGLLKNAQKPGASLSFLSLFLFLSSSTGSRIDNIVPSHLNLYEHRRLEERSSRRMDSYQTQVETYVIVHPLLMFAF